MVDFKLNEPNGLWWMTEPLANKSGVISRQLADQLKTVFVVALLSLWLVTLNSTVTATPKRLEWWPLVILSVLAPLVYLFWRRKRVHGFKLWLPPGVVVVFIWIAYWISGVPLPAGLFVGLAIGLLIWAVVLFLALILITTRWGSEGKLGNVIMRGAEGGEYIYWPLSFLVLLTSILLGWFSLWDAGMRDWWMDPLLILGVLMAVVVAFTSLGKIQQRWVAIRFTFKFDIPLAEHSVRKCSRQDGGDSVPAVVECSLEICNNFIKAEAGLLLGTNNTIGCKSLWITNLLRPISCG